MKRYFFSACLLLASLQGFAQLTNLTPDEEMALRKVSQAQLALKALYVDTVNCDAMADEAIRGMLQALDPHSSYATAEETRKLNEPLQGSFDGIGVQFNILEDTLVVIQTVVKGPSEKVGILAGDRIVTVNDTSIAGVKMDRADIMKRLRGPRGTVARLEIVRRGVAEKLKFDVVRDKIPLHTLDAAYMIRPGIGFIRLSSFGATSDKEVDEAIVRLKKEGMKKLIFDLEDNGGGYLQAAVDIASQFLHEGDMVVYTDGRSVPAQKFHAKGGGRFQEGEVVVLVDTYSASASEILSGAIQDHDRGLVVGRRTFGKGLVQRGIPLPGGASMRITVSHYYTPSGRCIQKPYTKGNKKEYEDELYARLKSGELMHADSIHVNKGMKYKTLREGRDVYGGGGIVPDVFVPLDTTATTPFYNALSRKNIIVENNLRFLEVNRKMLNEKYKTFENYKEKFVVPQSLIDAIYAQGERAGVKPRNDEERERTTPRLATMLKSLIARDLWDLNEFYGVMNEERETVKCAIGILSEK